MKDISVHLQVASVIEYVNQVGSMFAGDFGEVVIVIQKYVQAESIVNICWNKHTGLTT